MFLSASFWEETDEQNIFESNKNNKSPQGGASDGDYSEQEKETEIENNKNKTHKNLLNKNTKAFRLTRLAAKLLRLSGNDSN